MPSRDEVLTSIARLNATPKIILPPTPTAPSMSGYTGALGDATISRVSDRVRAREATKEVAPQSKMPAQIERERIAQEYRDDYFRREAEAKVGQTKRDRIRAEKRRVEEARRIDDLRIEEAKKEIADRQSEIAVQNMVKAEIRGILADASADEIQEVLKRVDRSRSRGVPFAYKAYLDEVRAEQSRK